MQGMLTDDTHPLPRARFFSTRLHKHRYNVASARLERIHRKMKSGQIVDLAAIAQENAEAEKAEKKKPFRAMADYKSHYFMSRMAHGLIANAEQQKPKTLIGATITAEESQSPPV
jgi:hypothetical protein